MTQTSQLGVRRAGDETAVVDLTGEITAASEQSLTDAYNRATDVPTKNVILNFTDLEYLNSSGIGLLVTMLVRANRQKQRLAAFGLTDHYKQIFELTRLDEAIRIFDDEQSAVDAHN